MLKKTITILSLALLPFFTIYGEKSDDPSLEIGDTISSETESYSIVAKLGEGAFGKVFSVQDSNGNKYAIKCYKNINLENTDQFWTLLADVQREYDLGCFFDHPHIIRSYDLFKGKSDDYYLVLELVEGKTVSRTRRKAKSLDETIALSLQLVKTMEFAADMDYFFLDMHSGNIMIDQMNEIKMIDLASFFTWDEVYDMYYKPKALASKKLGPIREKKLLAFINNNKELIEKLNPLQPKGNGTQEFRDWAFLVYSAGYFKNISDMCIGIIAKGDGDRNKKIDLQLAIKRISLNFTEDAEDGIVACTFQDHMQELINLLEKQID